MTEDNKPSHYYSYGPFRADVTEQGEQTDQHDRSQPPSKPSMTKARTKTSFRAIFASFMVGVIVVGSLMFYADKQNLFTSLGSNEATSTMSSTDGEHSSNATTVSNALDTTRPNNVAKIFEQASPAVVKIETYTQQSSLRSGTSLFDDPFFRQFFGNPDTQDEQSNNSGGLTPSGIGTGFFFQQDGYILTNQHVIANADKIEVTVQGYDEPFVAEKLGANFDLDLAVLKVKGSDFPTLKIGDSNAVNIGDWVVAIGNPYGFDHTVTVGVISAKERPISISDSDGERNYKHLLQTDASINPGNSGGPLLNLKGEVIGINTAISAEAQGIGFAIPTSTIQENLSALKANKAIPKQPVPFIGASLADITQQVQQELNLSSTKGSVVVNVLYKSPAYEAGLRQYDVITKINGKAYNTKETLIAAIQKFEVGNKITLTVVRDGKERSVTLAVGDRNKFSELQ